jgi:cystathionine beta-lyase/cystathionine gamma-synthase
MINKIVLNVRDLDRIREVVIENNVKMFTLVVDNTSEIGYTVDVEFEYDLNGRDAVVRVPIVGVDDW